MNHIRRGSGSPLLLVHGLGGSWRSWSPVLDQLAREREVVAVDLPGFGGTPPLGGKPSIGALADAVASFQREHDLAVADLVGSSMGARIVLELARGGARGATVALDPGGFWTDAQVRWLQVTLGASIRLVRALGPAMPALTANPVGRTLLFAQLSAHPWRLPGDLLLDEMRSYAASPSFDDAFRELVSGPRQEGADSTPGPVVIGWGRQDRITFPSQARRAQRLFPRARLEFFEGCGHFPHWDQPEETVRLILQSTGKKGAPAAAAQAYH